MGGASDDNSPWAASRIRPSRLFPTGFGFTRTTASPGRKQRKENHTVTFVYEPQPTPLGVGPYPAAQQRPSNAVGCRADGAVVSPNNSAYDPSGAKGLKCVNSGVLPNYGSTLTVNFPAQGNFKFTCLIHSSMFGTVHVLGPSATLPYSQMAYNNLGDTQIDNLTHNVIPNDLPNYGSNPRVFTVGKILGTGGGWQYGSLFRFVDANREIITKDDRSRSMLARLSTLPTSTPPSLTPSHLAAQPMTRPVGNGALVNVNNNGVQPSGRPPTVRDSRS